MSTTPTLLTIPEELRAIPHWINWRPETTATGKVTKVPYQAGANQRASTTDPATWCDFPTAVAGATGHDGGIGFVFNGDGLVGVDFDHVRNSETGIIAPWAAAIITDLHTYSEISVSGTGAHCITRGTLPPGRRKSGPLEAYDTARFFVVSGTHLPTTPTGIEIRDLTFFHRLLSTGLFANDDFLRLANNDNSNYPSASEADLAFCTMLAHAGFGELEIDRAVRLFRYRPKWDESRGDSTWGRGRIEKALASQTSKPATATSTGVHLLRTESGAPRPVLANAISLLRGSPEWLGVIAFDEFAGRTMLLKPAPGNPVANCPRPWTDNDDSLCSVWMQAHGVLVNSRVAAEAVQVVAQERSYDPARDYLSGLAWDGVPRIDNFLSTYFGAPPTAYVKAVGACTLIGGVARLMRRGCQNDSMPVAVGVQGLGKSQGWRGLSPRPEWFCDHVSPLGSKDSRIDLQGAWLVEFSELGSLRRSDIETYKAFLSAQSDRFRAPYERRARDWPRSCFFVGTTNESSPFQDSSGGRRFWPFSATRVDVAGIIRDRDQLWAEAVTRFEQSESWWLSEELSAAARDEQSRRYETGAWDETILTWAANPERRNGPDGISLPWAGSEPGKVNLTDALVHGVGMPLHQIKPADHRQAARAFQHAGWQQVQERSGRNRGKRYYMRPPICKESEQRGGALFGCSLNPGHAGEHQFDRESQ